MLTRAVTISLCHADMELPSKELTIMEECLEHIRQSHPEDIELSGRLSNGCIHESCTRAPARSGLHCRFVYRYAARGNPWLGLGLYRLRQRHNNDLSAITAYQRRI